MFPVLTEDHVNAHGLRIGAVDAGRVHHVGRPEASGVPGADKDIGDEPPRVAEQVRARQPRNATNGDPIEVDAVGTHGVQSQVEPLPPTLDLLGQATFRAAAAVELRRDDPDLEAAHRHARTDVTRYLDAGTCQVIRTASSTRRLKNEDMGIPEQTFAAKDLCNSPERPGVLRA